MKTTTDSWLKALRLIGLASIFLLLCVLISLSLLNGPTDFIRREIAVATSDETSGFSNRYSTAQEVNIQAKLNNKFIVSISQFEAHHVKKGDKILVSVWKRRFWGYKYTYDPL